jgi:two-component system chemotaxis sensor kinase CheA
LNSDLQDDRFIAEALPAFISEAQEQSATLESLLLQLEDKPEDRPLLDALFRCAHTIKGSAGMFGLDAVVGFTHHLETLLDRLREGQLALTPELGTLLLLANDQIRSLVAAAQHGHDEPGGASQARQAIVLRLQSACGLAPSSLPCVAEPTAGAAPADSAAQPSRWQVAVQFGADTFRNGMDPLTILDYLRRLGTIDDLRCDSAAVPALEVLDPESCHLHFAFQLLTRASRQEIEAAFSFVREDCLLQLTQAGDSADVEQVAGASSDAAVRARTSAPQKEKSELAAPAAPDDKRFIRVEAERLDKVINLLGELVIAGAGASLLARQSRQGALIEANQQITRLIEEVRNGTLQLRMVPIGETFGRFRRVVRDTAAELGKDVALEVVGGDTELDKSVVERIADPLMHLVRNALDHGLETPEQRLAAGKPARGVLRLSACHESGSILIRIADDGRGVQRDKVLQRAWERGLLEQGTVPADADILKLIFEAGFSTAEKVTNLSGRGVGMDVVRRNIEALRGSVCMSSTEGEGSCIDIRLPLTLAIIDGFLIGVGPSKFILPLESVVEVIESRPSVAAMDERGRSCVELRGQLLPVVNLRTLYALDSPQPERSSVLVIGAGGQRYGVMVDLLLGQHQTVIKPLGRMLRSLRGISGSSILGTGEVALIFDVNSLSQLAAQEPQAKPLAARLAAPSSLPA